MITMYLWYVVLVVVTILDIVTTKIGLSMGAHEVNPLMAPVVEYIWVFKVLFLLVAFVIMWYTEKYWSGSGWKPVCAGACVTGIAVASNTLWLLSVW